MPFFNRQNNDDLILAIQVAGMSSGRNGFRKDKGGKNLPNRKSSACRFRSLRRKNTPRTPHRRHRRVFSHTVEATSLSIRSTSAARLFVPTRAERNLFRLCRVQPNLVHLCTNSRSTILSASRYQAFHNPIRLGKS